MEGKNGEAAGQEVVGENQKVQICSGITEPSRKKGAGMYEVNSKHFGYTVDIKQTDQ